MKISRLHFSRHADRNILFRAIRYGGRRISRMIVMIVHCGISAVACSQFTLVIGALSGRANPIIISYLEIFRSAHKSCGAREVVVQFIRVGNVSHVK